ncbi:pectinesterase family protein [Mangrovibacterium lignilyticum]|uniref:pectinesterase family protein n=1 Tax=Mangrovibacterium lignilyticum TaxID=2668052 RepID=UPI0013D3D59C|nr:pectinesterase family protein [Mangrovibacterium lignilyticum]
MKLFRLFTVFILCLGCLAVQGQSTSITPDIVVALDGSGDFSKIQDAIDAVPSNNSRATIIYLKRGLYNTEKLLIPSDKKNISLIGESRDETIISYHIYDCTSGKCPTDDAALWTGENIRTSATLTIQGSGFRAENLTIQNTAGPVGQALAITVQADRTVFVNCNLLGYQDTIYLWSAGKRSYFKNCLVLGRTDYIYGSGIGFFDSCEIRSYGGGWITAPATPQTQAYGFVFYNCNLTYALNSPRSGDDGATVRFGRPWHEYPKVAWLYCNMTEMINPAGWGDTWNMDYAATSKLLHLYEYQNTGAGSDMSNRADWAGLRSLTSSEAENYTAKVVLAGSDNWDPSAEASLVPSYEWIGTGPDLTWMTGTNWDPQAVPQSGESATVSGKDTLEANGGSFLADLNLNDSTKLIVSSNSTVNYLAVNGGEIQCATVASLSGKIASKDSLVFDISGTLTLNAQLTGVHKLVKKGTGRLILNADNSGFSGAIIVESGQLEGAVASSLGKGNLTMLNGAEVIVSNDNAFQPTSKLSVETGAQLQLNANVTTSEFYLNELIQSVGVYSASTTPDLITGTGQVIVGRPEVFTFIGGENGNWDNPAHFIPALLPEAGETVNCSMEMETTSTEFTANVDVKSPGNIRLRGTHSATGTITMEDGTFFNYNTGGTGMTLNAPIEVAGDITMIMESDNTAGSTMSFGGPISGTGNIVVQNNGKGTVNTGTVALNGDNSGFTGVWDLTVASSKYPTDDYISVIEGTVANAFGSGTIKAALNNKVIFSHAQAAGNKLTMELSDNAKAVLNENVTLEVLTINGTTYADGVYSSSTHPDYFEGTGNFLVGDVSVEGPTELPAFPGAEGHGKYTTGGRGGKVYYVTTLEDNSLPGSLRYAVNQSGPRFILFNVSGTIQLKSDLKIENPNITIAGQTAPGDGICLRDYSVSVNADNVIIRYLRFRMGDEAAHEGDAIGGRYHKNIIVDHCSMSWSTDETVSFYVNENFSLQWCIISESLRNSVHDKGAHGYGGIWGGKNASFHHNLLAHHDSRNPRLGESAGDDFALTDLVDLRNNVIYNWGGNSCYGGEAMNVNIVNCYYKPGPVTSKTTRIISIDKNKVEGTAVYDIWGKFYINGNYVYGSTAATEDNWTYGVYNQFHSSYGTVSDEDKAAMRIDTPHDPGEVTTHTAEKAYKLVLDYAGASLVRDAVDDRIVYDTRNGVATYTDGGNGSTNGIIDTQSAVGGWPVLNATAAPTDTDGDGMPDVWEEANGLDKDSPNDAQLTTVDGRYPNIEVYINSLVSSITDNQNETIVTSVTPLLTTAKEELIAYFNSGNKTLTLKHTDTIQAVFLYNLQGQLLLQDTGNTNNLQVQLGQYQTGLYIVKVGFTNGGYASTKVVIP